MAGGHGRMGTETESGGFASPSGQEATSRQPHSRSFGVATLGRRRGQPLGHLVPWGLHLNAQCALSRSMVASVVIVAILLQRVF